MAMQPQTTPSDHETHSLDAPAARRRWSGITPRAFVLGLLLIPLIVFWVEYTEIVARGPDLAAMALPTAVIFTLLVVIGLNRLVGIFRPSRMLTQAELMTVFSMNAVALGVCGIGQMQFLVPTLVGWRYFAASSNGWANQFYRFVPIWATPDASVVSGYYNGRSSLFTTEYLRGWASTIVVWTLFFLTLLACLYCIATLMRKQWVERERLVFPIVQIPLEITREGGDNPLWRNKLLWMGALIPLIPESMAAIHFTWLPAMPYVPLKPEPILQIDHYLTQRPWNALGSTPLSFYPFVVGLTYLLPLDVSFSCWFFFLLTRLENVMAAGLGFRDPGAGPALANIPYINEQAVGAWIGLALFSISLARPLLAAQWRRAFRGGTELDDTDEPLSYRTAFLGLFITAPLLVGFGIALGLSPVLSLLFWGLFLLFALTMTRIRAEAGLAWGPGGATGWGGAHQAIINIGGSQSFSPQDMTGLAFLRWFDSDLRCLAQPIQLETMKLGSLASPFPINPRQLTAVLAVASLVGLLSAWASCLGLYYHYGASSAIVDPWRTGLGHFPFDDLHTWLNNPMPPDQGRLGGALAGLGIVSGLSVLRTQFVWWPLHPIGYAVGNTDIMIFLWCPTLLGWLAKTLILRYGGAKFFRQALPFFIGLILGDYAISGILALISAAIGQPGYRTFPN